MLLTAAFVLGQSDAFASSTEETSIELPVVSEEVRYRLGSLLWRSADNFGAAVATLDSELPDDVVVVERFAERSYFESLRPVEGPGAVGSNDGAARIALSYGDILGQGLAFIVSRIMGRGAQGNRPVIYSYHATAGGSGGAPVFDSETGELICIHMGAQRIDTMTTKRAFCTWVGNLLDEIRAD